jgi:hypothetical protein
LKHLRDLLKWNISLWILVFWSDPKYQLVLRMCRRREHRTHQSALHRIVGIGLRDEPAIDQRLKQQSCQKKLWLRMPGPPSLGDPASAIVASARGGAINQRSSA